MKHKVQLALLSVCLLSASVLAQTQNIPIPASAVNGGRAVVAIKIPAATVLPSDLCTASNGNCVTDSEMKNAIALTVPSDLCTASNGNCVTDSQMKNAIALNLPKYEMLYSSRFEASSQLWQTNLVACIKGSTSLIRTSLASSYSTGNCPPGTGPEVVFYGTYIENTQNEGK